MSSILENQTILVACPACEEKVELRLSQILETDVPCPQCGAAIDTTRFRRSARNFEQKLAAMGSAFGKAAGQ